MDYRNWVECCTTFNCHKIKSKTSHNRLHRANELTMELRLTENHWRHPNPMTSHCSTDWHWWNAWQPVESFQSDVLTVDWNSKWFHHLSSDNPERLNACEKVSWTDQTDEEIIKKWWIRNGKSKSKENRLHNRQTANTNYHENNVDKNVEQVCWWFWIFLATIDSAFDWYKYFDCSYWIADCSNRICCRCHRHRRCHAFQYSIPSTETWTKRRRNRAEPTQTAMRSVRTIILL